MKNEKDIPITLNITLKEANILLVLLSKTSIEANGDFFNRLRADVVNQFNSTQQIDALAEKITAPELSKA